ncbi:hypothetical protein AAG570_009069 [Ranatra chinensis]|uniref:Uncharacterized protein n=1 Tax=Ranatra chinensis TaxID=642074 RepID=A0ABD0YSN8_9HEMI
MASKRRNMFQKNKTQETTENVRAPSRLIVQGYLHPAAMLTIDLRLHTLPEIQGRQAHLSPDRRLSPAGRFFGLHPPMKGKHSAPVDTGISYKANGLITPRHRQQGPLTYKFTKGDLSSANNPSQTEAAQQQFRNILRGIQGNKNTRMSVP